MSEKFLLAVDSELDGGESLRRLVSRLHHTEYVEQTEAANLLITDNVDRAEQFHARDGAVLFWNALQRSSADIEKLQSFGRVIPSLPHRFDPPIQTIWSALETGKLGTPGLLRMHGWRGREENAKGCVLAAIDLACWFFGSEPAELLESRCGQHRLLHFGFSEGGMALIDFDFETSSSPHCFHDNPYDSCTLIGASGAAYWDDHDNKQLLWNESSCYAVGNRTSDLDKLGQLLDTLERLSSNGSFETLWHSVRRASDVYGRLAESVQVNQVIRRGIENG